MHAKLKADYRARHRNPITLVTGETVITGIRDLEWPEFIWATDPRGRSGWVHQSCLQENVAIRDYDARELDANAGDEVRLVELLGGWWWAENQIGERGWLPERVLAIEPGMK